MTINWEHENFIAWCNSTVKPVMLKMDQACLNLHNWVSTSENKSRELELWGQSTKCQECPLWKIGTTKNSDVSVTVNTTYPTILMLQERNNSICNLTYHFGEFGQYFWNVSSNGCEDIVVKKEPANIYLPLLWSALIFFGLLIMWGLKCILEEQTLCFWLASNLPASGSNDETREGDTLIPADSNSPQLEQHTGVRHRIRSLDTFRGLTISLMILVNYGGGGYWFLRHSPWNGITLADVVFPWFVWIMGFSSVLSLNSQLRRALSKRRIFLGIFRRSIILFLIGLALNSLSNNNIYTLRIPGVLQRLGFVYFIVAVLELLCLDPEDNQRYAWYASVRDFVCSWRQWMLVSLLILAHLLITFYLPVPGCPLGYIGPGGLQKGAQFRNCTGGAARMVDVAIFGNDHIYQRPTPSAIYDTSVAFDPEGFLGSLTCVLCAYLGVEAGKILLTFSGNADRIYRWMAWSVFSGAIGGSLCLFSIDEGPMPMNKNLWSVSYVLVTSSSAFFVMTLLYVFVDVLSWWSGAPLRYAGMNAILLYVGHVLAKPMLPFTWSPLSPTHGAHYAMNITSVIIWIIVAWILYRFKVFLTL